MVHTRRLSQPWPKWQPFKVVQLSYLFSLQFLKRVSTGLAWTRYQLHSPLVFFLVNKVCLFTHKGRLKTLWTPFMKIKSVLYFWYKNKNNCCNSNRFHSRDLVIPNIVTAMASGAVYRVGIYLIKNPGWILQVANSQTTFLTNYKK